MTERWRRIKSYYRGNAHILIMSALDQKSYERIMRAAAQLLGLRFGPDAKR